MLDPMQHVFLEQRSEKRSGIFITFAGNCKKALTFYQACFGGVLDFEMLDKVIEGYNEIPVISGVLISDRLVIYGSDLVQDGGRKIGNHIAVFLSCQDLMDRRYLIQKLALPAEQDSLIRDQDPLVEIKDSFDVNWILGV